MREEFKRGLSYNSIFSARSALGHCFPCNIINHSAPSTFYKGVYNLRPPTPKYFAIWDVNTLLSRMQYKDISTFYSITKKLATPFMILGGTRVSTIVHLKATNMYIAFTFDFCPATTLVTYLEH